VRVLVSGGAGFIGSNFVRHALQRWPEAHIVVLDKLTYAGNMENLADVLNDSRFSFVQGDICSADTVHRAMSGSTHVVNFAAETHVDRSILEAGAFVQTDVEGTRVLLEAAKAIGIERYLQVSTDEVYGDVEAPHRSREDDPLLPRSPYSASKAGGDLMVRAYHETFDVPTLITRGSNTFGPYQYPEKLISLFITNALTGLPLPMYGDGMQVRDYLYVEDHCAGIATVLERGEVGEIYNIGAGCERPNREAIDTIISLTGCDPGLVRSVPDRPGHDRRYALDLSKISALGWSPQVDFSQGMQLTVDWYTNRGDWWEPIKDGTGFREYYRTQYEDRLAQSTP
jgi:dTDP-glucose 4,6-dehydratase